MAKTIEERAKECLVEVLAVSPDQVTPEANIIEDLGADSLDMVEIVMSLEEEFGIEIDDEDVINIATVAGVLKYLETREVK